MYHWLPSDGLTVEALVVHVQLAQHTELKKCQQAKFQRICDKHAKNKDIKSSKDINLVSKIMSRWAKSCSDCLLSNPE